MNKWDLPDGTYLPSAIAVLVGEITANPDKYKYVNVSKLLQLAEDYADTRVSDSTNFQVTINKGVSPKPIQGMQNKPTPLKASDE